MATTGNGSINDMAKNLMANGMKQPGQSQGQGNAWEQMMMMSMLRNMSPKELLGFNIGKLLQGLFGKWKDNYDFRGDLKAELSGLTPEEREQRIAQLKQNVPNRADYIQRHTDKWFPQDAQAGVAQAAAPASFFNQDSVRQAFANAAPAPEISQGLLGLNNPLTQKADIVDVPFDQESFQRFWGFGQ